MGKGTIYDIGFGSLGTPDQYDGSVVKEKVRVTSP